MAGIKETVFNSGPVAQEVKPAFFAPGFRGNWTRFLTPVITRLTARFERRPLARPNLPYVLWRFVANANRTSRALLSARRFDDTRIIARELRTDGIAVRPSETFLSDDGRFALSQVSAEMIDASRKPEVQAVVNGAVPPKGVKDFRIDLIARGIPANNALLKVALDVRLLEIVAAYLGMWPSLHSIGAWLNYPTSAAAASSQLWHHDPEDLKIIKTFIYLEDVAEENGPFTYIPGTHPFGRHVGLGAKYKKSGVADAQLSDAFPPATWRVCTGPANTMILADTVGYHRGGKPTRGTRLLVTFTYTSGTPMVQPSIWLKGAPDWIASPIQQMAIRRLGSAPPVKASKKK